ncbi:BTAD domain-containing putative transcriptional regulator [Micromonospora sp. KC213]|uniref:AfsR/SARP family transcriptional regulator n=1 Tax=Micromonospora sp. KC213 TaxID=2530378 RepID=UPI001051901F|nr:BTAD domain-containing putative transcriptional regulator [Micromonospora sp. KC213]TDC39692.1 AfsR/SARP family transcriptional regulator [Micromonospora sp. KC213]
MRFGVLGPLAVWTSDGRPVRIPEAKVRALLADLLAQRGRPVSADRLIDDLWGTEPPGNPANTLQTKVSQLRRALERAEPGGRELVAFQPAGYVLCAGDVDAEQFTDLLARARATDDPLAKAGLLADALALWRGPAYTDFPDAEFARSAATGLAEQRLTALEEQAEVRLALGDHSLLADELAPLVAELPLRERLRAAHLRALYRSGRQSEALAGFDEVRRALAEELGLDPGPELVALHQAVLTQDPALAPAVPPVTSAVRPRPHLPAPISALVGRDEQVAAVRGLLASARLVTVTGPGGVGKTRLVLAAAAQSPDDAWLVELAALRAGGVAEVADVVAGVLGVRDEIADRGRPAELADRLADALRGHRMLLVLDNCEHLVEPVAELALLLLRAAPGVRILATSQEPLAIAGESLHQLGPLGPDDAAELFRARAGNTLDADDDKWVTAICARTGGLECSVAFTGHAVVATALPAADVHAHRPDGFGGSLAPDFLRALAGTTGWIGVIDATLARRGVGGTPRLQPLTHADDHPRVQHARQLRTHVRVFGDDRGLVTLAAGLAGRTELSIELHRPQESGHGEGRSLLTDALTLIPDGKPVFAAVSPGNARSLRAFLAAGFAPISAEVILRPDRTRA